MYIVSLLLLLFFFPSLLLLLLVLLWGEHGVFFVRGTVRSGAHNEDGTPVLVGCALIGCGIVLETRYNVVLPCFGRAKSGLLQTTCIAAHLPCPLCIRGAFDGTPRR